MATGSPHKEVVLQLESGKALARLTIHAGGTVAPEITPGNLCGNRCITDMSIRDNNGAEQCFLFMRGRQETTKNVVAQSTGRQGSPPPPYRTFGKDT